MSHNELSILMTVMRVISTTQSCTVEPDTIEPEESVPIREVSLFQELKSIYTNMALGEEESVLFREVSLFQGCPYIGVPLYHVQALAYLRG